MHKKNIKSKSFKTNHKESFLNDNRWNSCVWHNPVVEKDEIRIINGICTRNIQIEDESGKIPHWTPNLISLLTSTNISSPSLYKNPIPSHPYTIHSLQNTPHPNIHHLHTHNLQVQDLTATNLKSFLHSKIEGWETNRAAISCIRLNL